LLVAMVAYGAGYLIWYLDTPLGRAPQLDGAENLALAGKIAAGTLPHEPFYRALLYPAMLSVPLKLGLPAENLPAFASVFGLFCHFLITLGVARLAARLWIGPREKQAAWLAGALWAFNPVALFYAVDVLDTVPSLALAIWALVCWSRPGARKRDAWVGGVLLGLAVAARPHFLPLVIIAPLARSWLAGRWKPQMPDVLAWAGVGAMLLLIGTVQAWWSGEFRILPSQGPYNFYAANRPGANGRYYTQQIYFDQLAPGENPAQKEEAILYDKVKLLNSAPESVYWDEQAWSAISQNPRVWLKLMVKKVYFLLNDFDQYNNKTYAWHQTESPWLDWNFLGWGVLLVLSAGILALRGQGQETLPTGYNCPILAAFLLVFCAYSAGVILYYASGRFRLPLAPLLCVLVGGWMTWPGWTAISVKKKFAVALALIFAGAVAFSNFFNAHDHSTFIQDEMLSANAAAQIGDDLSAMRYANMALASDPHRPDARRVALVSYFNLTLLDDKQYDNPMGWRAQLPLLQNLSLDDATLNLVAGVAHWKTGDTHGAEQIWQAGIGKFGANSPSGRAAVAAQQILGEKTLPVFVAPDPQMLDYLKIHP
jgi:hypothetical protein